MADLPNGGRIVPIVSPARQRYALTPPDDEVEVKDSQQLPQLSESRPSKHTRSKTVETECLELPCLTELGLYALPTEGDGNCLYYALSDQLYGDFFHAEPIRIRLADHIAANRDYFISFMAAVGGERRAPRRAAALAARHAYYSSSSASPAPPSVKDKERSFDFKVAESRKNGVWGGAEEIQAFCQSFKKDVNVYTMYGIQNFRDVHAPDEEERDTVHIAFHDFHHYSSVRHIHGPHQGLPHIPKFDKTLKKEASSAPSTVVDLASPWKISAIQEGLGGKYDRDAIVEMLQQCRGNIDRAFINLLGEGASPHPEVTASKAIMKSRFQSSSRSSSPFSTGSKRSADDSDSEENPRPAVRRTRAREQKRRILPDVTVGIAFRDDQNDLVSLRLRVGPGDVSEKTMAKQNIEIDGSSAESATENSRPASKDAKTKIRPKAATPSETSQSGCSSDERKLRRSQRISRGRNPPQAT
ncbi:hypothetical protein EYZ11_009266 [Aspergillus tanneri]|uniref:OTU domain-containing protein n=1 Tax=Aspergillus tanneri TaxID=1220188 RepID=A0A4S3J8B0_9EURO|nr:uncharacterized protein ATNIH1004_001376 [Aspergillus tanneri]KAA8652472.1 hypothetical protein ATNIH1004_001376 [Aspergillus tanneri]THC91266.1 hypothetical protein EYZ11_009266 [Aspergillus tanneri]